MDMTTGQTWFDKDHLELAKKLNKMCKDLRQNYIALFKIPVIVR